MNKKREENLSGEMLYIYIIVLQKNSRKLCACVF